MLNAVSHYARTHIVGVSRTWDGIHGNICIDLLSCLSTFSAYSSEMKFAADARGGVIKRLMMEIIHDIKSKNL